MRYELPDRQSDIESDVVGSGQHPHNTPPMGQPVPALVRTYYNFIQTTPTRRIGERCIRAPSVCT